MNTIKVMPASDSLGKVAPYALLSFYEPLPKVGVPVTTYADAECTIANCHPIISNSDGEFGPIYFATQDPVCAEIKDYRGDILMIISGLVPTPASSE